MTKVLLFLTLAFLLAFAAAAETASASGGAWWAFIFEQSSLLRAYVIGIATFAIFSWIFLKMGPSLDTAADTANDDKDSSSSSSNISNEKVESVKEATSAPVPPAPKVEKKKANVSPAKKRAISPGKKGK